MDQEDGIAGDDAASPPPPMEVKPGIGFGSTVLIMFAVIGLMLFAGTRVMGADEVAESSLPITDLQGSHPCPPDGEYDPAAVEIRSMGELVRCLQTRPASEWPIGVFDVDGSGFLLEDADGEFTLRAIRSCRRDSMGGTETTVVQSLGWEFQADQGFVSFHLPGYGGARVETFEEELADGTHRAGARISGGTEPGPEVELPDTWQQDGLSMGVMNLYACGVPLEQAVRMLEPRARG